MSITLSKRLKTIASFIPKGARFADIGSDHAYIPCAICKNDPTAQAIAGEVRRGPYESAQKTVEDHKLEAQVDVRLGDGLDVMDASISHVIIAGMGGSLIESILEQGKEKLSSVEQLILQPNIGSNNIRRWTDKNGFEIIEEQMIEENGHIYEIIVAKKMNDHIKRLHEKEIFFGPKLLQTKSSLFLKKWRREQNHLEYIVDQMKQGKHPDQKQLDQFHNEIEWIKEEVNNG